MVYCNLINHPTDSAQLPSMGWCLVVTYVAIILLRALSGLNHIIHTISLLFNWLFHATLTYYFFDHSEMHIQCFMKTFLTYCACQQWENFLHDVHAGQTWQYTLPFLFTRKILLTLYTYYVYIYTHANNELQHKCTKESNTLRHGFKQK